MQTKRLRLEGASLPELQARVLTEHGHRARIIAAEQVTVGGIRGFFAKRHIEVTVEVPDAPIEPSVARGSGRRRATRPRDELTTRLGIAALLDDADATESRLRWDSAPLSRPARDTAPVPEVSTDTPDFARLMDELTFATLPARRPDGGAVPVPVPTSGGVVPTDPGAASGAPGMQLELTPGAPTILTGPGDLVVLVGLPADVALAAALVSADAAAPLYDERVQVTDRRSALSARAGGVEQGRGVLAVHSVLAQLPADTRPADTRPAGTLAALGADQVWVVVNAGRKPADTARWVRDAGEVVTIDAVAVLDWDSTATPGTVAQLGLPIGWLAPASVPRASAEPSQPFAIG